MAPGSGEASANERTGCGMVEQCRSWSVGGVVVVVDARSLVDARSWVDG